MQTPQSQVKFLDWRSSPYLANWVHMTLISSPFSFPISFSTLMIKNFLTTNLFVPEIRFVTKRSESDVFILLSSFPLGWHYPNLYSLLSCFSSVDLFHSWYHQGHFHVIRLYILLLKYDSFNKLTLRHS